MSYGSNLQSRLAFNFDTNKFGSAIDPYGDLNQKLSQQSTLIKDNTATIYTAFSTSNVSTSTYFKNPLTTVIGSLTSVLGSVYNTVWNYSILVDDGGGGYINDYILRPVASGMDTTYSSLGTELTTNDSNTNGTPKAFNTFISHTNRLSNLQQSNKENRPSFSSAQTILKNVQTLIYQTETTATSTVGALGLGAYTSLFIESDLNSTVNSLNSNLATLTGLLASNPTSVTPSITAAVTAANTNFTNLLSLLQTRRTHDENFYVNAVSISQDYNKIISNKSAASTSSVVTSYLIDNLIGTNALKNL